MINNNPLKFSEDTRTFVTEISALSGIPQNIIKEVLEFMVIDWAIKIGDSPDSIAELPIPYLGKILVKYEGDSITPEGELSTDVRVFVNLSDSFKKLVGDIHDEAQTVLTDLMQKKLEQVVMVSSATVNED